MDLRSLTKWLYPCKEELSEQELPCQQDLRIGCLEADTVCTAGKYFGFRQENLVDLMIRLINEYNVDLFLAPEWVFLPGNRIYRREEKERIVEDIARRTSQRRTLVFPGTFMWEDRKKVRNSTPVISEGRVIKEYCKHLDGGTRDIAEHYNLEARLGKERGTSFKWNGLDVGLEICADHGELKINGKIPELDLQVVLACGMSLYEWNLKLKEGGHAVLCDGSKPCSKVRKKENGSIVELSHAKQLKEGGTNFTIYEIKNRLIL